MYVDVGENRPFLEKLPFAFVSINLWKTIAITCISLQKIDEVGKVPFESTTDGGGDPDLAVATALTGVVNEHFSTIRDWIKWFLQNESEVMMQQGGVCDV